MGAERDDGRATIAEVDLPLTRDGFFRSVLRGLTGTLEDVVGVEEASSFVSVVGDRLGRSIDADYRRALGQTRLTREQVADVLVDVKRRIGGDFSIVEQDDDHVVLANRACPFGEKVLGRPSLCMMTSNVFGVVAAENLGYARIDLQETIAAGAPGCRVVIHLRASEGSPPASEREYFAVERPDAMD